MVRNVVCPLCRTRRARRLCPALGSQICAVCCGTKRLVEIHCPADCVWLASAREHPPAVAVRRQQYDITLLVSFMRDLSERQSQLFFFVATFLVRYETPDLQSIVDEDVADAVSALAATFETSAKGVIYEHRPGTVPAQRLMTTLKAALDEAGAKGGTAFERDAATVLRRVVDAARAAQKGDPAAPRAFLTLLGRVITTQTDQSGPPPPEPSKLIVP